MPGTWDDHAKAVALEFFVTRLLVNECLRQPSPTAAVAALKSEAEAEGRMFSNFAFTREYDDQSSTALNISYEIDEIAKAVEAAVIAKVSSDTDSP